jgi:four helix bundle protein
MNSYKDLIVWQKSFTLTKKLYILTNQFPKNETYGLISQIRRAAVSIPSNIAEGHGRKSDNEHRQFYSIAYGSALELETQLLLAKDLEFIIQEDFNQVNSLLEEVLKMLNVMTRKK